MPDVFLSYARANAEPALRLYHDLSQAGVDVWLDQESLLPGQLWKPAIESAIRSTRYFIALLSTESVNRRGYVQKELVIALDVLDEFPSADIFVIPARLEECTPGHSKLKDLNWVDLFPDWDRGVAKILKVITQRAEPNRISAHSSLPIAPLADIPKHPKLLVEHENTSVTKSVLSGLSPARNPEASPAENSRGQFSPRYQWRIPEIRTRGLLAIFTGFIFSVVLPVIVLSLWLDTWHAGFSFRDDSPINPAIATGFVLLEVALATFAGWITARIATVSPRLLTALIAFTWLALWLLFAYVSNLFSRESAAYIWLVTIEGFLFAFVGGWIHNRPRRYVRRALGAMVLLTLPVPLGLWLLKASAPSEPYVLQHRFSTESVALVAISTDGGFVATLHGPDSTSSVSGSRGVIRLWHRQPRKLSWSIPVDSVEVRVLRFSPEGKRLLGIGRRCSRRCTYNEVAASWDVETGRYDRAFTERIGDFRQVDISADGRTLATQNENTVRLWDMEKGELLRQFPGRYGRFGFAPAGRALATITDFTSFNLWDAKTGVLLQRLNGQQDSISALAFAPDGIMLGTGGVDGKLSVWEAPTGILKKSLPADTALGYVHEVAFSPDGRWIASRGRGVAVVWDVVAGRARRWNYVRSISFMPDSKTMIIGNGREFGLWDVQTGKLKQLINPDFSPHWLAERAYIAYSANGEVLVTGQDSTVAIWQSRTQLLERRSSGGIGPN